MYELYYSGEILSAASPNSRLVITGDTSSVNIYVREMKPTFQVLRQVYMNHSYFLFV